MIAFRDIVPRSFVDVDRRSKGACLHHQGHRHDYGDTKYLWGRAMAKAVSRRPLTAEARFCARDNQCGICDGKSDTGTALSPSFSVFPCQYHSTVALLLISSGG
jgi:hypothetical protein